MSEYANGEGQMWVDEALEEETGLLRKLNDNYESLKNKDTNYARAVLRMMNARAKTVAIFMEA